MASLSVFCVSLRARYRKYTNKPTIIATEKNKDIGTRISTISILHYQNQFTVLLIQMHPGTSLDAPQVENVSPVAAKPSGTSK